MMTINGGRASLAAIMHVSLLMLLRSFARRA
jgi:hypothetical protein